MTELERRALQEVRAQLAELKLYTIEKILGMGGAGVVLKVQHRVFGVRALKLVHAGHLSEQNIRDRFDTEARIMHKLNHPNVVRVHDLGELQDGSPYIVMDFLEGGTLEDHLNEFGLMPPRQAVRVAIGILRGLQAAHDAGVVHRDIKVQNILFDKNGTAKITDFGIARVEEGIRSMTRQGATMGTFAYMPPEQLSGELDLIDHRADIHALGVTLYVMLTCGKLGKEAFFRQIEAHPERIENLADVLQMVIRMATSEKPESRFASAAAMADELEIYLATGLPDDPADTPALGSAPAAKAQKNPVVDAPDPQIPRVGATMVPSATRAQPGYEEVVQAPPQGVVSEERSKEREPSYTIHPEVDLDVEAAELEAIRQAAKHRFYRRIVLPATGIVLALVVGVGVWFATRPDPVVEVETIVETIVEPTTAEAETLPTLSVEPIVEAVVEPTTAPIAKPTLRVVAKPPPEAAVTVQEKVQVRLTLMPDTTATVTLTGDGGTFTLTGGSREVPQGTYRVSVDMPGVDSPQTGTLTVTPGLTVITCDGRFMGCKWPK